MRKTIRKIKMVHSCTTHPGPEGTKYTRELTNTPKRGERLIFRSCPDWDQEITREQTFFEAEKENDWWPSQLKDFECKHCKWKISKEEISSEYLLRKLEV